MKMYQVYLCDYCGAKSQSRDEIELCEAKHMGLKTLEEKRAYDALSSLFEHCGSIVSNTNNERTRQAQDDALEKLMQFEKEHGIKS